MGLVWPLGNIELKSCGLGGDGVSKAAPTVLGSIDEGVEALDRPVVRFADLKREPDADLLFGRLPGRGDDGFAVERKLQRRDAFVRALVLKRDLVAIQRLGF